MTDTYQAELDRESGAEAEPFATEREIATAIIKRIAHNEGDTFKTACELAEILKECAIPYTDLYNGMKELRRDR